MRHKPIPLRYFLQPSLLDARPVEIDLTPAGHTSASQAGAEVAIRELAATVRRWYRAEGGQDVIATAEEREDGRLVLVLRPFDEATQGEE
jgi:hypothetical protein